jgi:hypothetical protein
MQCSLKGFSISSFIVNITDYRRFQGRVASHVTFATLGGKHIKGWAALL